MPKKNLEDPWEALGDIHKCKEEIATTLVFMLRVALEIHGDVVRLLLTELILDVLADELPAAVQVIVKNGARL